MSYIGYEVEGYVQGSYLTPGKGHRRTPGKATFEGKGMGIKCKSVAYWGTAIYKPLPHKLILALAGLVRMAHQIGGRVSKTARVRRLFDPAFHVSIAEQLAIDHQKYEGEGVVFHLHPGCPICDQK